MHSNARHTKGSQQSVMGAENSLLDDAGRHWPAAVPARVLLTGVPAKSANVRVASKYVQRYRESIHATLGRMHLS
ncbi:hypothetical protein K503DRAFT_775346 [Rhizopogon vinicolor AM-OR11-026]|uniref:Uncharacterized protein n=1 Tax=Rhizopogon vinicolor AM-OR11-026 TaxID=1314800 RepID=A0A1B7MM52_9AGAM|nr:hypothetical protein K503DRAFT_775346 [Rhizopogon vinicolor AM-OR11-026]